MSPPCWLVPDEMRQWDDFVQIHPFGSIYHLSAWKRVLEESFRHIKGHILVRWDSSQQRIISGLPIYTVNSALLGKRLISMPLATLCDPLVSSQQELVILTEAAIRFAHEQQVSSLQLKTCNSSTLFPPALFQKTRAFKHHFIRLDRPLDTVRARLHPSCIQRSIQKAKKHGITIRRSRHPDDLRRFYDLFVITRKRHGLPPVPFRFFRNIHRFLGPTGMQLFLAQRDTQMVAGLMMLFFKDMAIIEYSADDETSRRIAPNQLLCWRAIEYAHREGFRIFSFGRTYRYNEGLLTYKRRWGTEERELPEFHHLLHWSKLSSESKESSLPYRLIQRTSGHLPLWSFKLLGDLMYRHLG